MDWGASSKPAIKSIKINRVNRNSGFSPTVVVKVNNLTTYPKSLSYLERNQFI